MATTLSKTLQYCAYCCLVIGILLMMSAGYIQSKAAIAQLLIARAYQLQVNTNLPHKPWPWADTTIMAKLMIKKESDYILANASMRNLAFGPAHMSQTPLPGSVGNSVIVGHRDTHFEKLKDIQLGEIIQIERDGIRVQYRVAETAIVDESQVEIMENSESTMLTLITCYPFNSVAPNPKQRFVVRAIKET